MLIDCSLGQIPLEPLRPILDSRLQVVGSGLRRPFASRVRATQTVQTLAGLGVHFVLFHFDALPRRAGRGPGRSRKLATPLELSPLMSWQWQWKRSGSGSGSGQACWPGAQASPFTRLILRRHDESIPFNLVWAQHTTLRLGIAHSRPDCLRPASLVCLRSHLV